MPRPILYGSNSKQAKSGKVGRDAAGNYSSSAPTPSAPSPNGALKGAMEKAGVTDTSGLDVGALNDVASSMGSSNRYNRSVDTSAAAEEPMSEAEKYISDFQAPESVAQIAERKRKESRGLIDEIKLLYRDERDTIESRRRENLAETNATSVNTGLAGGPRAFSARSAVNVASDKELKAAQDIQAAKLSQVYATISKEAQQEAREQRLDARAAAKDAIEWDEAKQTKAKENLQLLAASGADFDKLKSNPKNQGLFQYALKTFGGNEEAARAYFALNRPVEQVKERRFENGQLVQIWENPVNGKTRIEITNLEELGFKVPRGYTNTVDLGGQIMMIPDNFDPTKDKPFYVSKSLTPGQAADAAGGGSGAGGAYANDLDALIGATLSTIPSKFGQETFKDQITRARNDSDRLNLVAAQVLKNQPSEIRTDFVNQSNGIANLDKAIALIDTGIETGALNSATQYVYNIAGKDYDPKLAQINGYLVAAIQPYRNSVTGAAWGTQEDGEYQQLFGSTKYSPQELRQRLVQTKEILKNKSATGLNAFVNPLGYYDNAFETGIYAPMAGGPSGGQSPYTPSGGKRLKAPDGQVYDASELTPQELQDAIAEGYIEM